MVFLRIQQIEGELGIVLPPDLVREKGLREGSSVHVEVERGLGLDEVAGTLAPYGLTTDEWNDATNEGEPT